MSKVTAMKQELSIDIEQELSDIYDKLIKQQYKNNFCRPRQIIIKAGSSGAEEALFTIDVPNKESSIILVV